MYNPQLETFLKAADSGSFNKAAEELYITATAVIKQINLLESSLDVKLFERTHRGLTLTKAGKSLYRDAKYIIRYCEESVVRAKNAMQSDSRVMILSISLYTIFSKNSNFFETVAIFTERSGVNIASNSVERP